MKFHTLTISFWSISDVSNNRKLDAWIAAWAKATMNSTHPGFTLILKNTQQCNIVITFDVSVTTLACRRETRMNINIRSLLSCCETRRESIEKIPFIACLRNFISRRGLNFTCLFTRRLIHQLRNLLQEDFLTLKTKMLTWIDPEEKNFHKILKYVIKIWI